MSFINANTANPNSTCLGYTICHTLTPVSISNTGSTPNIIYDATSTSMAIGVWLISASIIFSSNQLYSSTLQIVTPINPAIPGYNSNGISNQTSVLSSSADYFSNISLNVTSIYYNVDANSTTSLFGICYTCNSQTPPTWVANDNIVAINGGTPLSSTYSTITYTKIA